MWLSFISPESPPIFGPFPSTFHPLTFSFQNPPTTAGAINTARLHNAQSVTRLQHFVSTTQSNEGKFMVHAGMFVLNHSVVIERVICMKPHNEVLKYFMSRKLDTNTGSPVSHRRLEPLLQSCRDWCAAQINWGQGTCSSYSLLLLFIVESKDLLDTALLHYDVDIAFKFGAEIIK